MPLSSGSSPCGGVVLAPDEEDDGGVSERVTSGGVLNDVGEDEVFNMMGFCWGKVCRGGRFWSLFEVRREGFVVSDGGKAYALKSCEENHF